MEKLDRPCPHQWYALYQARLAAMAAAHMVLGREWIVTPDDVKEKVELPVAEQDARVRGNRHVKSSPNWEDARYTLAATLRECLELLEGEQEVERVEV